MLHGPAAHASAAHLLAGMLGLAASLATTDSCITRVSISNGGIAGDTHSGRPAISADGRVVAFTSAASRLVRGDANDVADVFVHDRVARRTVRVSVASDGTEGNATSEAEVWNSDDPASELPAISGDGRFVAFKSWATNLVPGDTNRLPDIFIHDRDPDGNGIFDESGSIATTRVSVSSRGTQSNGPSSRPALSDDGRIVAFETNATNLIPGDTNNQSDIVIHDRDADEDGVFDEPKGIATTRVSVASDGAQVYGPSADPTLSADGRIVAFESRATTLVPRDNNNATDVFVHNRSTGETTMASVAFYDSREPADSHSYDPVLSADGRFVAFGSTAIELVQHDANGQGGDVFVRDRGTGLTVRVSVPFEPPNGNVWISGAPAISADGRFVSFSARLQVWFTWLPGDPVPDDAPDVFVHDRDADGNGLFDDEGGIAAGRVSVSRDGVEGDLGSDTSALSADGRFVAFASSATNLVPGDDNASLDIFVYDRQRAAVRPRPD